MDPKLPSPKRSRKKPADADDTTSPFPAFSIVGVGASAGGLEAFTELLRHLPPDTGMAFVLVQHLDPSHESILAELLSSKTSMSVVEATDGLPVAPDSVYVIPPAADITIERGALKLSARSSSGHHHPVDLFLASLARDRKAGAVAVILSGTAADGAEGVRAVRKEGGATLAQDPGTAKHRGMPENAIATGAVDFVLPIPLIARQLSAIAGHPDPMPVSFEGQVTPVLSGEDPILTDLLNLVRSATRADFSHYKQSTVMRRISRRMTMRHAQDLEAYLQLVREDPAEVEALYQDLLIRVTSFFRQPHVFDTLKQEIFPQIAEAKAGGQVRFWVPGCSTGEEAYSLAIAWAEFQGAKHLEKTSFQIFASDINQQVIDRARGGIYPEGVASDVSPERLERFFTPVDGGYQIAKSIREACVFAKHDLTRDPPFSRVDLISLRNVLIYLGPLLQRRVMPLLHFALRSGGFLLLGESESVGGYSDLFSLVDKKGKIYRHSEGPAAIPPSPPPATGRPVAAMSKPAPLPVDFDPSAEADRIVLDQYAPVGVIVDADLQIRRFRGHTGPYLEPGPGRANFDFLRMAREGLAGELRSALREARKDGAPVRRQDIRVLRDGKIVLVGFDVILIKSPAGEASFLVLFHDSAPVGKEASETAPARSLGTAGGTSRRLLDLEGELSEMREYARAALEDKESVNEELRSANEELQSTNEELQSVNEELETASEELQSTNEELRTLNEELHAANSQLARLNEELASKNKELAEANAALDSRELELRKARDYAVSVIETVREPLLVLDPGFGIVSASPSFYSMFKTDAHRVVGRSFFELEGGQWDIAELRELARLAVADTADFQDLVVHRDFARLGQRTMLLSGRYIRSESGGPENVLLAIEDITERTRAEALSDALDRINLTMISAVDFDEILERAMTEAARALECEEAVFVSPEDASWTTMFSLGSEWASPGEPLRNEEAGQFSALAAGQRAVVSSSSLEKRARFSSRNAGAQTVRVPLRSRDSVVGAMSFGRRDLRTAFTEEELDFVEKLAPALSLALENARLFAQERRIAEVLQKSLLKPISPIAGYKIGLAYRPAHEAELVGGDFYDFFPLGGGRAAAAVGDVSGKGVQAATLTETVRAILRTLASLDGSPASILSKANELMQAQTPPAQFVTVLLAIVDPARGKVVISSAGHPPPIICGQGVRFLDVPPATPLGAMHRDYPEAEFDLVVGETLVLYTDGLIEARRGADLFGERKVAEVLARADCAHPQKMVEELVSAATDFVAGRLADDLAVIAIHLQPQRS
ncbi:MAG: chemotaxis protein CheB [bacterium]